MLTKNIKRHIFASALVFASFLLTDFIIHCKILYSSYQQTSSLWRPELETKFYIIQIVNLLIAIAICLSYCYFVKEKNIKNTFLYAFTIGFIMGISGGYITYSTMPITSVIAFVWFVGILLQKLIAGIILYFVYKNLN